MAACAPGSGRKRPLHIGGRSASASRCARIAEVPPSSNIKFALRGSLSPRKPRNGPLAGTVQDASGRSGPEAHYLPPALCSRAERSRPAQISWHFPRLTSPQIPERAACGPRLWAQAATLRLGGWSPSAPRCARVVEVPPSSNIEVRSGGSGAGRSGDCLKLPEVGRRSTCASASACDARRYDLWKRTSFLFTPVHPPRFPLARDPFLWPGIISRAVRSAGRRGEMRAFYSPASSS